MSATILRQWLVLMMLPRPPRRIDTGTIEGRLRERGIEVHRRTIQRDLLGLAEVFPIIADERAKPYGWRWCDDAEPGFDVLAPNPIGYGRELEVALRVPKSSLRVVSGRLGLRRARASDDEKDPTFCIVSASLDDSTHARRLLVAHGDEVEVLAPPPLRREVVVRAQRVLATHRG